MPHLPLIHHETSKRDSPNKTKVKEKQNKTVPDSNSNLAKSMTHHNQTKELTTWFLMGFTGSRLGGSDGDEAMSPSLAGDDTCESYLLFR
jgi:hypothetical protein